MTLTLKGTLRHALTAVAALGLLATAAPGAAAVRGRSGLGLCGGADASV